MTPTQTQDICPLCHNESLVIGPYDPEYQCQVSCCITCGHEILEQWDEPVHPYRILWADEEPPLYKVDVTLEDW